MVKMSQSPPSRMLMKAIRPGSPGKDATAGPGTAVSPSTDTAVVAVSSLIPAMISSRCRVDLVHHTRGDVEPFRSGGGRRGRELEESIVGPEPERSSTRSEDHGRAGLVVDPRHRPGPRDLEGDGVDPHQPVRIELNGPQRTETRRQRHHVALV